MENGNFKKLSDQYLFLQVSKIIKSRSDVINLSVGDVSLPLPSKVVESGIKAATELKDKATFRGYPPESGYDFFKQAVVNYYNRIGVKVATDDIFVSDGIKSDMALFLSALKKGTVLLPSPCYPAYVDANILRGNKIEYYSSFPPLKRADFIVICSPDNPTGKAMSKDELACWVKYAINNKSLILFDAAYQAFVRSDAPKSIYEIEGAELCAVEFCSLSKTAGFTGIRCGYTVVPTACGLNGIWRRVKSCLSNGVSYVTQRMAACALTDAYCDVMDNIAYYQKNAALIAKALDGAQFSGGVDSPYIWLKCGDSWTEFYKLLDNYGIGVTPGVGFGSSGDQFVRINVFCDQSNAMVAAKRLKEYLFCK